MSRLLFLLLTGWCCWKGATNAATFVVDELHSKDNFDQDCYSFITSQPSLKTYQPSNWGLPDGREGGGTR